MTDRDGYTLERLVMLWDPWYEVTRNGNLLMLWHARRRDDGATYHAREARELHDAISDQFLGEKWPAPELITRAD